VPAGAVLSYLRPIFVDVIDFDEPRGDEVLDEGAFGLRGEGPDVFDPVVQAQADLACPHWADDATFCDQIAGMPDTSVLDACAVRLAALQQQITRLQGEQIRLLARLDAADESAQHWVHDLVSCVLRVSIPTARTRLGRARLLVDDLRGTLDHVERGLIPAWYADTIAAEARQLPASVLAEYEKRVLKRAAEQTMPQLRQAIRRAQTSLDPTAAEQRRQSALQDRRVSVRPLPDGVAGLWVEHSADVIHAVWERLDAAARLSATDDPRTLDQRRADVFVDGVLSGLPRDAMARAQGRYPTVQVVVAAGTLLGADDQPGWLAGYGPITAQHAREIAADPTGTWRRILTDPHHGDLIDAGATRYRPSQRLIDFLAARDGVCAFPPCERPAHRCEVDHTVPFNPGQTVRSNTALTCKRHNEIKKQEHGWSYRFAPDGSTTWTHHASGLQFTGHPPERWLRSRQ